ncbi:uncharacterized protein LOC114807448 [Ornithorhynchus anatinus]|uniref:uncharacterized protein LOC114807448 n=1 Tax=Ornithorhynchus anatinus TaxID=9258 RepID=UPI0019D4B8D7|nr:uncharacterized protein LOC114807448 [Ornithorhynchus anatinus]
MVLDFDSATTAGAYAELTTGFQVSGWMENLHVNCPSAVEVRASRRIGKCIHFVWLAMISELRLTDWRSLDFWFIILLITLLWFVRLFLHYYGQWLFLKTVSIPVIKFQIYPHTFELCYQNSALHTRDELAMVLVGPLMLNAVMLLMVLIRWGCQLLFAFFPDSLSKLIIVMGLWTALDPLAVFVVDVALGRLTYEADSATADVAKLYWFFIRTKQSGVFGILITVLFYLLLFIISSTILYLYLLRWRVFKRGLQDTHGSHNSLVNWRMVRHRIVHGLAYLEPDFSPLRL